MFAPKNVWVKNKKRMLLNLYKMKGNMPQNSVVIFVCEHGTAKSIIAATYFNHLANKRNLDAHAIARGINPDSELSSKTISGLQSDGLSSTEFAPQKLTLAEVESAERIISFCELPEEYQNSAVVEEWNNIPAVSENYEKARDAIIAHIHPILNAMAC
jgi:arsenate reductase (thioredoxin)